MGDAVGRIDVDELRLVGEEFFFLELAVGGDDDQIPGAGLVRRGATRSYSRISALSRSRPSIATEPS
jgi:hypothetical protein